MSFSKVAAGVGFALMIDLMQVLPIHGNCNGCADETSCVNLVDDAVYGCYGSFSSGVISDSALNLCKRGQGYHMCESANEAEILGLTINDCQNKVPSGHHFWSLESSVEASDGSGSNQGQCYSKNGPVTYNDRPRDDVWGCASSQTDISICNYAVHNTPCGPFNKACDAPETGSPVEEDGVWLCPCEDIELFTFAVTDATLGGAVCCRDTVPTDTTQGCDESITLYRINPGFVVPTPNFAPYVGKYYYHGNDASGYPRYVHSSGSVISISLLYNKLVVTFYSDYDNLYSTATTFDDGLVIDAGNNRWEIVDTFFSPPGTDMSASLTNNDQIPFYNPDHSTDSQNFLTDFQFIATFSDCPNYGLELTSNPTASPSPAPTDPTQSPVPQPTPSPVPTANECENYDHTVYSSCDGDIHCANCQPWGCAQCASGYYKRGNLKRCQSCNDNYQNCANCGDWNGCTACNSPYQLQWNPTCSDETCQ